ncbi:MAG: PEP-CTERM sorting domain-containing protein [Planctomycetota bacterium]|nr:MAG: PEP-CTERM sorting domain-containing protein [Planctomycetota bacterium]
MGKAIVLLCGLLAAIAQGARAEPLVPFDVAPSASDPLRFDVFNPHEPGAPVEFFTVEPSYAGGVGQPDYPVHAVLDTAVDPSGQQIGLIDLYFDGPADGLPASLLVKVLGRMTTETLVPAQSVVAGPTTGTSSEIHGSFEATYPAAPSFVLHEFTSRPGDASDALSFVSLTGAPQGPGERYVIYELDLGGVPLDTTKPLIRVEMRVSGVPEPGSLALLSIGAIGWIVCVTRRRRWPGDLWR